MKTPADLHKMVRPTPKMLRYWWGRLNSGLFNGRLPVPAGFGMHSEAEAQAEFGFGAWAWYQSGTTPGQGCISFVDAAVTKRHMLSTLMHEMVHQYQDLMGKPLVHGRYFKVISLRVSRKILIPVM